MYYRVLIGFHVSYVHFMPLNHFSVCVSLRTVWLACQVISPLTGSRSTIRRAAWQTNREAITSFHSNRTVELLLLDLPFRTLAATWISLRLDCIYTAGHSHWDSTTHRDSWTVFRVWTKYLCSFNRLSLPGFIVLF